MSDYDEEEEMAEESGTNLGVSLVFMGELFLLLLRRRHYFENLICESKFQTHKRNTKASATRRTNDTATARPSCLTTTCTKASIRTENEVARVSTSKRRSFVLANSFTRPNCMKNDQTETK